MDVKEFIFDANDYDKKLTIFSNSWDKISVFKQNIENLLKKKQMFLATPEIEDFFRKLTYSKYITIKNQASDNTNGSRNEY